MGKTMKNDLFLPSLCHFALYFLVTAALANPALNKNAVTVSGECRLEAVSDRGQLTVNVETLDKDVSKASKKTTEIYNKLKKSLEKLAIEDLQISTSGYNVYEQKEWENNKSISKGFKATLGMKVETNQIDKFSEIIKTASDAGISNIGNFSTFLSMEKQKKLALECLKVATQNAQTKAKTLAEGLGSKIGKALMISELEPNYNQPPMPVYGRMEMMKASDAAGPEISASTQEYSKQITVSFELL
jgi:uncharacterized protein YggE